MKPWVLLDEATVPDSGATLGLYRRGEEYSIRVAQAELMNSRLHASEDALAQLACRSLGARTPRILIGGLGLGFTLAQVLRLVPAEASVIVAELVPAVVRWNTGVLGHVAGKPLADPRVRVEVADVGVLIAAARESYDAILLDVDNGPTAVTHPGNEGLYSLVGLTSAHRALRPLGVLAVWSAAQDPAFAVRLRQAGFSVEETPVRARAGRGAHHWIWVGVRGARAKNSTL
ncbi:MAG: hypothetical protein AAB426_05960 [Myxococcota bacterium]